MQHIDRVGKMAVDHFDPRKKKNLFHAYDDLFPATTHCNRAKWFSWPTKSEERLGCRFLNPCKEMDYGVHIFEDAKTHELFGATPAGKWHIRVCGLNAPHLIRERAKRTKYLTQLKEHPVKIKAGDLETVRGVVESLRAETETMIPSIPFRDKSTGL
jgi:hypothetical protein